MDESLNNKNKNGSKRSRRNRSSSNNISFLDLQVTPIASIAITVAVMAVLIAIVFFANIPNPNMILIAGLVICSALFGFSGGIPAALIMLGYTVYFFSDGHDFVSFSTMGMSKVFVSVFGIVVDMLFVCLLKRNEKRFHRQTEELTEELKEENAILAAQSVLDALTGIGNRLAIRKKIETYLRRDIFVIMMDVDDFKHINDDFGHAMGDDILKKTGALLAEVFGDENCYRYGGDEFLVIIPGMDERAYEEKCLLIRSKAPEICLDGKIVRLSYSAGWIRGTANTLTDFHRMLNSADKKMYEVKSAKKPVYNKTGIYLRIKERPFHPVAEAIDHGGLFGPVSKKALRQRRFFQRVSLVKRDAPLHFAKQATSRRRGQSCACILRAFRV